MLVEQAMIVEKAGMVGSAPGVQQHLAGDVAPGQVGDHRAPDREVRPRPLGEHGLDHRDRQGDGVMGLQRPVDLGERGAQAT
jgi:hypothetical protein